MYYFGTVSSYVQKAALLHKAQKKLDTPYGMLQTNQSDAMKEADQQAISQRIETIKNKLKAGKKLTAQDFRFLRKHAPELFEKAVKIAKEREEYQKKLKKCRSKEEAQRIHLQKTQEMAGEAGSVSRSNISKAEKLDQLETINMRIMALTDEYHHFISSDRYKRLPDKADEEQNRKEEIKAADTRIKNDVRAMEEESLRQKQQEEKAAQAEVPAKPGEARTATDDTGHPPDTAERRRDTASPPTTQYDRAVEAYRRQARRR